MRLPLALCFRILSHRHVDPRMRRTRARGQRNGNKRLSEKASRTWHQGSHHAISGESDGSNGRATQQVMIMNDMRREASGASDEIQRERERCGWTNQGTRGGRIYRRSTNFTLDRTVMRGSFIRKRKILPVFLLTRERDFLS